MHEGPKHHHDNNMNVIHTIVRVHMQIHHNEFSNYNETDGGFGDVDEVDGGGDDGDRCRGLSDRNDDGDGSLLRITPPDPF